jgi:hypothetical protein
MKRFYTLAVTALMTLFASTSQALACDAAGPNAHVGIVTAVDRTRSTLTLKDAGTGKPLTFQARPDLLRGIEPRDAVTVRFALEGKTLKATSIDKAEN